MRAGPGNVPGYGGRTLIGWHAARNEAAMAGSAPHPTDASDLPMTASPPSAPSYVVEVGGRCVSQFGSLTQALSAGLTIKGQDAGLKVKVYDARERATD